jgi:hypothetical protein
VETKDETPSKKGVHNSQLHIQGTNETRYLESQISVPAELHDMDQENQFQNILHLILAMDG